jgi:serine/threonine protein kinase
LEHPNIMKLIEIIDDKNFVFLIYEKHKSEGLMDNLIKQNKIEFISIFQIFYTLLETLKYCHSIGVI